MSGTTMLEFYAKDTVFRVISFMRLPVCGSNVPWMGWSKDAQMMILTIKFNTYIYFEQLPSPMTQFYWTTVQCYCSQSIKIALCDCTIPRNCLNIHAIIY